MLFTYFDPATQNDWTVSKPDSRNDCIIIQKITPEYKPGDSVKKVFRVEDSSEYTFKCLKTKIKADKGADGLLNFMQKCKTSEFGLAYVRTILNFAWDGMREYNA